ncbi:BTB/POZ domain-containing protein KCTD17 [Aphelenchoides avenae]|nr:BTB/POZ domain-containing protein KCTD17 [Aphelenchus avenae]
MASDEVPAGWVRLNVGGRIFVTMKQTLGSSPFFARLFGGDDRMPDATAGSSTYFIDRDADRFTKILHYMRDGNLFTDKNCNLLELRVEADFYGLDDLLKEVEGEIELRRQRELKDEAERDNCPQCKGPSYAYRCYAHSCGCARDVADDMLKDIVSVLETHGYILDRSVETAITAAGNTPTSWTFVKREG